MARPITHGRFSAFKRGCRCDLCVAADVERTKGIMSRRKAVAEGKSAYAAHEVVTDYSPLTGGVASCRTCSWGALTETRTQAMTKAKDHISGKTA